MIMNQLNHRKILFKIIRANPMQSVITDMSLGDARLMSSHAERTAAMIEAAMTRMGANRS